MKKPIFSKTDLQELLFPEMAIASLKVRREFDRSIGVYLEKIVVWLGNKLVKL